MREAQSWKRLGWSPLPYPFEQRLKARARRQTTELFQNAEILQIEDDTQGVVSITRGIESEPVPTRAQTDHSADLLFSPIISLDRRRVFAIQAEVAEPGGLYRLLQPGTSSAQPVGSMDAALIERACVNAHRWTKIFGTSAPLLLIHGDDSAAKLSPDLESNVSRGLEVSGLAPARLCVTFHEATIRDRSQSAMIRQLLELGIGLGIADFDGDRQTLPNLSLLPTRIIFCSQPLASRLLDGSRGDSSSHESSVMVEEVQSSGLRFAVRNVESAEAIDRIRESGVNYAQVSHLSNGFDQDSVIGVIAEGLDPRSQLGAHQDSPSADC